MTDAVPLNSAYAVQSDDEVVEKIVQVEMVFHRLVLLSNLVLHVNVPVVQLPNDEQIL